MRERKSLHTTRSIAIRGWARKRHGGGGVVEGGCARQKPHSPRKRAEHNPQHEFVFSPTGKKKYVTGGGVSVQGCAGEVRSRVGQTTGGGDGQRCVRDNGGHPRRAWGLALRRNRGRRRT